MSAPGLAGCPVPFEFQGQLYHLAPCTFRQRAAFGAWVQEEAYRGIHRHRALLGEEVFRVSLEGWRHDLASHAYDFGELACHRALFTQAGMRRMAFLLMKADEADRIKKGEPVEGFVTEQLLDQAADDAAKWQELTDLVAGVCFPNAVPATVADQSPVT